MFKDTYSNYKPRLAIKTGLFINIGKLSCVCLLKLRPLTKPCLAAKKQKLRLVVVTDGFLKWHADTVLRDVGPSELLHLYENAEYIVTDAFHGVAFSIIFEKQFLFTDCNPSLAERALNLMELTDCAHCACLNGGTGDERIDYSVVSAKVGALVERSKRFVEEALL